MSSRLYKDATTRRLEATDRIIEIIEACPDAIDGYLSLAGLFTEYGLE